MPEAEKGGGAAAALSVVEEWCWRQEMRSAISARFAVFECQIAVVKSLNEVGMACRMASGIDVLPFNEAVVVDICAV